MLPHHNNFPITHQIADEVLTHAYVFRISKTATSTDNQVNRKTYFWILTEVIDHFEDQLEIEARGPEIGQATLKA